MQKLYYNTFTVIDSERGKETMKVVITGNYPEAAKGRIRESFPADWEIRIVSPGELEAELATADVLIPEHVQINAALLENAPELKLVQTGSGYDNVDLEACTRYGVQACNAAGVNANAVAEHVMAFILCRYKNILYLDNFMKAHKTDTELNYTGAELSSKTIGILGMGNVGKLVAQYCRAFGMTVLGYSRSGFELPGIRSCTPEELYRESDILTVHMPLTAGTRHMINESVFRQMKPDALLINTSRGAIIVEEDLIRAVRERQIGGACLDVYENEPLPPDHPLRDLENVILTPHTAGLPDGVKYHRKRYEFFIRNIEKVMRNEKPDCMLNEIIR